MSLPTILMPTYASSNKAARNTRGVRQPRIGLAREELSPTAPFDDNCNWKLFITTSSKICAWDHRGCDPIFTSSSHGIVAAKRALDGSVLAIADAQVVMLHRVQDGQDKSYRLRGTQRCRLLQYSHDSCNLFYTDSFHNSVQSYSLADNRVADAARSHPSPISAFAVSCDSNIIVSASAKPPTVQIYNRMLATTISLVPSVSTAPVVICAFHPSRKHFFLLAFGDGVLGAYDYTKVSASKTPTKKENTGVGMVRCHARAVHAFRHLHDPSIAGSAGITGAGFVPGQRSRAVTVGEDGRCFLVDFEKGDTLGSWHIGAPATGLTIREIDASAQGRKTELGGYFIAVGTVHGRCMVYDGNGNKVAERVIDAEGESVLDVEWVCGNVSAPERDVPFLEEPVSMPSSPPQQSAPAEQSQRARKPSEISGNAFGSLYDQDMNPTVSLPAPLRDGDITIHEQGPQEISRRKHRSFSPPVYDSFEDAADQGYMNLFSPVKRKRVSKSVSLPEKKNEIASKPSDPCLRATQGSDRRSAISAPQLWEDKVQEGEASNSSIRKEAEAPGVEPDGFGAFQVNEPKETTAEESPQLTNPNSNQGSVFEGLSTVPGEQIQMDERTDDGRILSEIRSIRAMFSGKTKSNSEESILSTPDAPPKARSMPASRLGRGLAGNLGIRRTASAPEKKATPSGICDEAEDIERTGNLPTGAPLEDEQRESKSKQGEQLEEQIQLPHPQEGLPEDIPTEDGEEEVDIWAAQAVVSRPNRRHNNLKRKNTTSDESIVANALPEVATNLSRSSSATRSSKSRKTVSWSDGHQPRHMLGDIFPTPMPSSSVMGEYGGGESGLSQPCPEYAGPLPTSSQRRVSARIVTATTGTAIDSKERTASEGSVRTIDEIVKTALADMQAAMSQQMRAMQMEMQRQFREQHNELLGLRTEMSRVREENEKLRNILFQSSGVRDSVRRNIGSGGPAH